MLLVLFSSNPLGFLCFVFVAGREFRLVCLWIAGCFLGFCMFFKVFLVSFGVWEPMEFCMFLVSNSWSSSVLLQTHRESSCVYFSLNWSFLPCFYSAYMSVSWEFFVFLGSHRSDFVLSFCFVWWWFDRAFMVASFSSKSCLIFRILNLVFRCVIYFCSVG